MTIQSTTTQEISVNIIAQLEASLSESTPLLPKAFNRVLAKAIAGVFILLYKYGGFMFLQVFVRTASARETEVNGVMVTPLNEWGRLVGVGDPAPATNAQHIVRVNVTNQTGEVLPTGTQLVSPSNGITYITLNSVTLDAATVEVEVRAVSDQAGDGGAGAAGNLEAGDVLNFANALGDVARAAEVIAQTVTGSDVETTEAYRQRVIDRFQKPPQGGAYADYELWGEESAGILSVYPYTSECPGQVDVYVEATVESSGNADGTPTTAQLQEVLDSIELNNAGLASRRPAGALVNAFPIVRTAFDVTVNGLIVGDLAAAISNIESAITEYFLSREPYIIGLTPLPRQDRITASAVGGIIDSIVNAQGGVFTSVTICRQGVEISLYSLGEGEKAKLGTVSFP